MIKLNTLYTVYGEKRAVKAMQQVIHLAESARLLMWLS